MTARHPNQPAPGSEIIETRRLLADAAGKLRAVLQDEALAEGTPIETTTAMELALEAIETALGKLTGLDSAPRPAIQTAVSGSF
ncbi:MAG: hypothetical protein HY343_06555 [Lentisphaerae bacterium]|nr:hypothetical protein [Lentisphaerota bacterium]